MKKVILVLMFSLLLMVAVSACADVEINKTTFPDSVFRDYVSSQFDKDQNAILDSDEIKDVTLIGMYERKVGNLQGIEYFSELQNLSVAQNQLMNLDLSKNTKLETVSVEGNRLKTLILGRQEHLTRLDCEDNNLETLDISGCSQLDLIDCSGNRLTSLNISGCSKLTSISCAVNKIKSLNLKGAPLLAGIDCKSNQLTELDFRNNPQMGYIECSNNLLKSLKLDGLTNLKELECKSNDLTALNVSNMSELRWLTCYANRFTKLNLKGCPYLEKVLLEGEKRIDKGTGSIEYSYSQTHPEYGTAGLDIDRSVTITTDSKTVKGKGKPGSIESITLKKSKGDAVRTADDPHPDVQIYLYIDPYNTFDKDFKWTSSNEKVATVDDGGIVTCLKKGTVTITCQSLNDDSVRDTIEVTIKDKLVKSIKLNSKKLTLKKKETAQLEVSEIKPSNAVNTKVKWSTSDKKVAKVDKHGVVTAVGKGKCTITCEAKDGGGAKVTVKVKVK